MFLGGLGIFLFGVQTISDGLQKYAAHRLKLVLQSFTNRPVMAVLFGIVATVAFQSSAATNVLVVEFVNLGLMNLGQALGIVLGSSLGTSISILLISFEILNIALGAAFVGLVMYLASNGKWKYLGQSLIGFGLIFVGINIMSTASAPLKEVPQVYNALAQLGEQKLLAILAGLGLSAVLQSSNAAFAIMISLADQGLLNLQAVIPLVLGAHIGGTITPLVSSLAADKMDAKRTAIANTAYKVVGTVLILPFLYEYQGLVQWSSADLSRQVANAHLFFSIFMILVFFPFNNLIAKGLTRLLPQRAGKRVEWSLKYIDESTLEVPAIALSRVNQEVIQVAEYIGRELIERLPEAMLSCDPQIAQQITHKEKGVDWYYEKITRFINRLSQKGLTDEQGEEILNLQFVLKELEYIGDTVVPVCHRVMRLYQDNLTLGEEHWEQLNYLYKKIAENYANVVEALKTSDSSLAARVIREHPEILRIQRTIQFNALGRCLSFEAQYDGLSPQERLNYALVDLSTLLYSIDEHIVNIAQVVMGIL